MKKFETLQDLEQIINDIQNPISNTLKTEITTDYFDEPCLLVFTSNNMAFSSDFRPLLNLLDIYNIHSSFRSFDGIVKLKISL